MLVVLSAECFVFCERERVQRQGAGAMESRHLAARLLLVVKDHMPIEILSRCVMRVGGRK